MINLHIYLLLLTCHFYVQCLLLKYLNNYMNTNSNNLINSLINYMIDNTIKYLLINHT